jgi:hypothetical protein
VTKLSASGIAGPFDLVIDNGCYHSLSSEDRAAYVPEVAALAKKNANWYWLRRLGEDEGGLQA